jgi:predicted ribosomally synthesized peptide with nif11-like leader
MSLEQVKLFYQRFAVDEELRSTIHSAKTQAEVAEIIKENGFDFTIEEFEEYNRQLLEGNLDNEELNVLNEEELMTVVGGYIPLFPWPILIYGGPSRPWDFSDLQ